MARVYAGQTQTERAGARRRQLLDAGLALIGTRGWAETTVRAVCDEAGLSTRFFYESFAGLDALALAVYDEVVDETFTRVVEAVAAAGDQRAVRAEEAIGAMVGQLADDPRRARVVLVEAYGDGPLTARRAETMRRLASMVEQLGRLEYGLGDAEREPLVGMTAILVAGGVCELLIAWLDGRLEISREQLVVDTAALVVAIGDVAQTLADGYAKSGRRSSSSS